MELVAGHLTKNGPIGILPGSFHPPTVAHLGLARAALARVETVVFTLPRAFPHKQYEAVSQAERLDLLRCLAGPEPRFAVALSEGGLFIDMARELRALHPAATEVFLICGRDAAERIVDWPYPPTDPLQRQFEQYSLLVAARQGEYLPPPHLRNHIETLTTAENWDEISATRVRECILAGEDWRPLVPQVLHEPVEKIYSPSRLDSRNVRSR